MKENQDISLDDFIADIVVSLDAKYKELLCAETEIEKMGATARRHRISRARRRRKSKAQGRSTSKALRLRRRTSRALGRSTSRALRQRRRTPWALRRRIT